MWVRQRQMLSQLHFSNCHLTNFRGNGEYHGKAHRESAKAH